MIELIMFFCLGFLVAGLLALLFLPFIHARALRLAARRLSMEIPCSLAEIRADKDLLRAQFALSTRRFEMTIAELRARSARQMVELGRKSDEINRLKLEMREKIATICALEARNRPFGDHQTPDRPAIPAAPRIDQRALNDMVAELAEPSPDLDNSSPVSSVHIAPSGRTQGENNVYFLRKSRDHQTAIVEGASESASPTVGRDAI
jgi:hypothetical protein